jgi:polysaccharide pyruvyl transferase WcaK-like protein
MAELSAFLINDTSSTGHPGCVTVTEVIKAYLKQHQVRLTGTWPVGLHLLSVLKLRPAFKNADFFLINGEGTIHHTATRRKARRVLQMGEFIKRETGKPVYLINATIESVAAEHVTAFASYDLIHVRDQASQELLRTLGFSSHYAPDLTLSANFTNGERGKQQYVTDSVVPAASDKLRAFAKTTHAPFHAMRPEKVSSFIKWVVMPESHRLNAQRFYRDIQTASSVITGRFHATIFSILAETPFMAATSNTRKIQSLLTDVFGQTSRVIDVDRLGQSPISVAPFTASELVHIHTYKVSARDKHKQMFADIIHHARNFLER